MKEEDWLPIHTSFQEFALGAKRVIKNLYKESYYWRLCLTQKPDFNKDEYLSFNAVVFLNDRNIIIRDISLKTSPILFVAFNTKSSIEVCTDFSNCLAYFNSQSLNSIITFEKKTATLKFKESTRQMKCLSRKINLNRI